LASRRRAAARSRRRASRSRPEAALARLVLLARHLAEALVEREVVADGVLEGDLPAGLGVAEEGEVVDDPVVDHLQRHLGEGGLAHRQHDQLRVGEGRLD